MTQALNLDFCRIDGEVDGVLQLADVRQRGVRHGRARAVVGLPFERFTGWITGEFARNFKFSGLAAIRQSCREIERDDSTETDDVKKPTKYSKAEMFNDFNTEIPTVPIYYVSVCSHHQKLISLFDY